MAEAEKIDVYGKSATINSLIEIYGAPNSSHLDDQVKLDDIDANAHETFTLEEMRTLIINYRKKDKDFLIARVTTPDPEDQNVFYNFYYAAAEINRILFRFESSRRLLHRMKVKNPLNNMYIIGQVFYYKISAFNIDQAIVDYMFDQQNGKKRNSRKAFSAVFRPSQNSSEESHSKDVKSKDSMDIKENSKIKHIEGQNDPKKIIEGISKGEIEIPAGIPAERKIRYQANYFASDDDFLIKPEVRDYFKRNALEAEDDFLYEIDRTQNDFMALLDEESENEDEEVGDWRRIFSAHVSTAMVLIFICVLLGGGPVLAIVFLPLAIFVFLSFLCSLFYVLFCRRSTFDTMAVNSVDEDL
jgi:Domain of unknown function (DUF5092)